ncbi:MAG TPA: hypothetical protein PKL44_00420 [Candidatus Dojkabacteria bacterium]|nr:hypothetical protein [Candidatus Dojkabacteria bacterium]
MKVKVNKPSRELPLIFQDTKTYQGNILNVDVYGELNNLNVCLSQVGGSCIVITRNEFRDFLKQKIISVVIE